MGQSAPAHDDDAWGCVGTSVEIIGHTSPLSRQFKLFDVNVLEKSQLQYLKNYELS